MKEFNDRFYPETLSYDKPVFKNKMNIRNYEELEKAELEVSIRRLYEINQDTVPGDYDFKHLQKYHEYMFGDLYDWAGKVRTFGVMKSEEVLNGASVPYEEPLMIVPIVRNALSEFNSIDFSSKNIDEKTNIFCDTLATVWKAHPFNEGNTRSITKFMCDAAKYNGFEMDYELFKDKHDFFRKALVVYQFGVKDHMKRIVKDGIQRKEKAKEEEKKKKAENKSEKEKEYNPGDITDDDLPF